MLNTTTSSSGEKKQAEQLILPHTHTEPTMETICHDIKGNKEKMSKRKIIKKQQKSPSKQQIGREPK